MKNHFSWILSGALLIACLGRTSFSWAQAGSNNSAFTLEHPASPPTCKSCPQPDFPAEARKAKISSAVVMLDAMISADGQTDDIRVVSDPGHGFADNAVKAVKKWKFKPARDKEEKPYPVRVAIEVKFNFVPGPGR
jgi:TonB family protein